jgi:tetratricopeptide (TPR) repeat protein
MRSPVARHQSPVFFAAALCLLFFGAKESVCEEAVGRVEGEAQVSGAQERYAKALVRYQEIEAWKETKNWEAVYDQAPQTRKEIFADLDAAQKAAKDDPALKLRIADLRWRLARDAEDENAPAFFEVIVAAAREAVKTPSVVPVVQEIADGMAGFEDKNLSRRLYEIYVGAVAASGLSQEEFLKSAQLFLDQGNVYLAKSMYEKYLDAFFPEPTARAAEMVMIADKFAHPGTRPALDPVYAESLYQQAAELSPATVFGADSLYRRAYNLERLKDTEAALAEYQSLVERYLDFSRRPEALFRMGVLTAYAQKDIAKAQEYFKKIVTDFPDDVLVPAALYQAGLLDQGQKKNDDAKAAYDAVMAEAAKRGLDPDKDELVLLTRERLSEIAEGKDIKYGLRLFLEQTFKTSAEISQGSLAVDVMADPPVDSRDTPLRFLVTTSNPQTGCMMPDFSYEWSGETGTIANIPNAAELTTSYREPGLKVVCVVVNGNNGPEGAGFDIVQVS